MSEICRWYRQSHPLLSILERKTLILENYHDGVDCFWCLDETKRKIKFILYKLDAK